MMLGAEDGCNHPQPTGSNRPLICGREACFGAFWGVWDACIKRNVKTSHRDPPSAAARLTVYAVARSHTVLGTQESQSSTWNKRTQATPRALAQNPVKRPSGWPPRRPLGVAARLARTEPRSSSRLSGVRRAAGCSAAVRRLADVGAPTLEIMDRLGRA